MSDLPLARTKLIRALNYDTTLLIYVEGLTSGFGGRLIVERSPILIFPPEYVVREEPGNPGINPGASPTDVPKDGTNLPSQKLNLLQSHQVSLRDEAR